MIDSQMPWLSVGASGTDLDSSSSLSLLHSIYGSQASQLPFSESDTSITGTRSEAPLIPALAADWRQRPKSSPAATLASRARERHQLRPGGTADRSTALRSRRPASSAPRRPPSAVPGRKEGRARPKTALGMPISLSLSLEEGAATVIRDTAPVYLTHTPEYFNFWEGKPLLERDYGVEVHRRKPWSRPKSDYGSRFYARRVNKYRGKGGEAGGLETLVEHEGSTIGSEEGVGDRKTCEQGEGEDPDVSKVDMFSDSQIVVGILSLTNQNQGDDNDLGHGVECGRDGDGVEGGGDGGSVDGGGDVDGEGDGGGVDGGGDGGGVEGGVDESGVDSEGDAGSVKGGDEGAVESGGDGGGVEGEGNGDDVEGGGDGGDDKSYRHLRGRGDQDSWQRRDGLKDRWVKKKVKWETGNGSSEADRNESFRKKAVVSALWMNGGCSSNRTTRFKLPMDMLQLEGMSPLQYLRNHTVISDWRMAHCSKVFAKLDKDRDSQINRNDLVLGMTEVFNYCITEDQARSTLEVAKLPDDQQVDVHLFAAICCLAERMHNLSIARREVIEVVDFEGLEWKLRACTIRPTLRTLFAQL